MHFIFNTVCKDIDDEFLVLTNKKNMLNFKCITMLCILSIYKKLIICVYKLKLNISTAIK